MLLGTVLLVAGLVLLIGGADGLVRGVSGLARALEISPLIIGLTVVAFGTSTPELVVNAIAAAHGETDLAFGNLIGACVINIGFVLALTALIRPLNVESSIITRDLPMLLLGVTALVVLSEDSALGTGTADGLDRSDGLILLLLFGVFLYYNVMHVLLRPTTDPFVVEVRDTVAAHPTRPRPSWVHAGFTGAGLSAILLPIAIRGQRRIVRSEAVVLPALYGGYLLVRTVWAAP